MGSNNITFTNCIARGGYAIFRGIFRCERRTILLKIYDEEKENFEIKNVEFRNISYTSYLPSKNEGNGSDTNTVQVGFKSINANGFAVLRPSKLFYVGDFCDVIIEQ